MDLSATCHLFSGVFPTFLASGDLAAEKLPFLGWFTNSIFVAIIVLVMVLWFVRLATRKMELIPNRKQNFVEFVVEFLYGQVEQIVGSRLAPKVFPLLATIFIFILVANWFGLIPGVGTIGFGGHDDMIALFSIDSHAEHFTPIFRPATADLNMTLGTAMVFMLSWVWITYRELGVLGFVVHTFGPKGDLSGFLKYALMPIFFFVGVIEIISIMFRPISLSFRLFGNIFAGETLLHTMTELAELLGIPTKAAQFISSCLFPLPFYFMEILVGLLQAVVFALLCAVYVRLSMAPEEGEAH